MNLSTNSSNFMGTLRLLAVKNYQWTLSNKQKVCVSSVLRSFKAGNFFLVTFDNFQQSKMNFQQNFESESNQTLDIQTLESN